MSFLKKHYEKIILAFLLVIFVVLLVLQIAILHKGLTLTVEDVTNYPVPAPDYKKIDFKAPPAKDSKIDYGLMGRLSSDDKWIPVSARDSQNKIFTDFLVPYPISECPFCHKMIPHSDFPAHNSKKAGACSHCGKTLKATMSAVTVDSDSDGDGISDKDELAMGLNPKDSKDGAEDKDNDGFTNAEEYAKRTNINDPKSRPSYAEKLSVVEIQTTVLKMTLKNVIPNVSDKTDKTKCQIQIDTIEKGRQKSRFFKLGSSFSSDDGDFIVSDIIIDFKTELLKGTNATTEVNYSKVLLKHKGSDEAITAEINKPITEPRETIVFHYAVTGEQVKMINGDTLSLGDERCGVDKFTVVSSDAEKRIIQLKSLADGKIYQIMPYAASVSSREPSESDAAKAAAQGVPGGVSGIAGTTGLPGVPGGVKGRGTAPGGGMK